MGILLDCEEISPLVDGGFVVEPDIAIAKAQIRSIIDWLESFEFYEDAMGESVKLFRDKLIKTLLKEMNERL